ncbi:MAG: hypothetical protein UU76_C0027G0009 [Parcubacteria group bacterium GW2011_GWC1_41_7]|nr:MAG: hypothetical protein UU76_C0027G0009 [Parcubacteria group bacterium GW2011_GWC1_41_7]
MIFKKTKNQLYTVYIAMSNQPYEGGSGGYGKRSLWKWIVIYLVIGGIAYYLVYVALAKRTGGYNYQYPTPVPSPQVQP